MSMNNNDLISHIERYIGKISSSWTIKDDNDHIQIVKFSNTPSKSVSTFITLGVSHHLLKMSSGKDCRQELLFSVYDKFNSEDIASMLLMLSKGIITSHEAILRGSTQHIGQSALPNSKIDYLYASIPVLFPGTFDLLRSTTPETVFIWLIPLHKTEAAFVNRNGWSGFEKFLEEQAPDLFDLKRLPMI